VRFVSHPDLLGIGTRQFLQQLISQLLSFNLSKLYIPKKLNIFLV